MEIFDYDNALLLPRKCRVESRSECDTSVELGGRSFRLPAVPANMKTVVDESICAWLAFRRAPLPDTHQWTTPRVKWLAVVTAC